ncbi:hypothetical protein COTS27_01689 [Spirochaetota bacterium]|nr:hypothetical protein COTS27_01689 [Spirochaetota bacterium]
MNIKQLLFYIKVTRITVSTFTLILIAFLSYELFFASTPYANVPFLLVLQAINTLNLVALNLISAFINRNI